jgi:hypothetical protein
MKVQELRIGNLFQDEDGNILKVVSLTENEIGYYVVDRSKFPLKDGWKAIPIKITEEWLIKVGGRYIDKDYINPIYKDDRTKIKLWLTGSIYLTYQRNGSFMDFSCGDGGDVSDPGIKVPKHLHELQNLQFALDGEELECI